MFQMRNHGRFTPKEFAQVFAKLSKQSGIHVTPRARQRCFIIWSWPAGMGILQLQRLGGWHSLELVKHCAKMEELDLLQEYKAHSTIHNLKQLK